MGRARAGLTAAVVASLLAGCAGIPTSGPVVEGEPVLDPQPQYVGLEPDPPIPGASEEVIVDGFVAAMASYERDYPTARKFLSPDADAAWQPTKSTTIYDSSPSIVRTARGAVRVTMAVLATVGPDGYVKAPPGPPKQIGLTLEQVGGEWRISNPPAGIIVSDLDFGSEFQPHNLYFFDPAFERLVPDPVFVPVRGNRATLLTEALLRGPSRWIAPAVRTAFPDETKLTVPVRIESGQAMVELSAEAGGASPAQRERMVAQLASTLRYGADVDEVSVTSDRAVLNSGPTAAPVESFEKYDTDVVPRRSNLYALDDSGVVLVAQSGPARVPGPLGTTGGLRELAVDVDLNRAAVVDATGTRVVWAPFDRDSTPAPLMTGTDLVALSWDRTDLVWAVDRTATGSRVLICQPGRSPAQVDVAGLDGRRIDDLAVSLDGTRVAIAMEGEVMVGTVLREPDRPEGVRVDALRRVQLDGRAVTDVAWADSVTLAVLISPPGEVPEPAQVELARSLAKPAGPVPGARTLTASPDDGLAVGTEDGSLVRQAPTLQWVEIGDGTAPAYPG